MFSLTDEQAGIIQSTFIQLIVDIDTTSKIFYNRLFVIAPEQRALFMDDMQTQGRKLMRMLAVTVNSINDLDSPAPDFRVMGRHGMSGVTRQDFAPVGAALIWTLRETLGERFTPEVEAAWVAFYGALILAALGEESEHPTQPVRRVVVSV